MALPLIYIVQCYRVTPGDVGVPDVPTIGDDLQSAIKVAGDRLLAYFDDTSLSSRSRPHHARLVDEAGNSLATLMVNGFRKIQQI